MNNMTLVCLIFSVTAISHAGPFKGKCGGADKMQFPSKPSSDLCKKGSVKSMRDTPYGWKWKCKKILSDKCKAYKSDSMIGDSAVNAALSPSGIDGTAPLGPIDGGIAVNVLARAGITDLSVISSIRTRPTPGGLTGKKANVWLRPTGDSKSKRQTLLAKMPNFIEMLNVPLMPKNFVGFPIGPSQPDHANSQDNGFFVKQDERMCLNLYNICRCITNERSIAQFIPTNSPEEWDSFTSPANEINPGLKVEVCP